jgi:hypothetical protein
VHGSEDLILPGLSSGKSQMHCRITGKGRAAGDAALRGAEGELIVTGHTDEVVGPKRSRLWLPPLFVVQSIEDSPEGSSNHDLKGSASGLTHALAVHLLRVHASFPVREVKGSLPRWRLRRALAYIEEHLEKTSPLLSSQRRPET